MERAVKTREEAERVIMVGVSVEDGQVYYTDAAEIHDWAVDAVAQVTAERWELPT